MAELQRDAPLFDKVLVVKVQNSGQQQETGRQIPLTLRIIPGTRPTVTNGQSEKLVHIEITDDNDPYFLYILDVGEQDFHHLKRDQSLLVEFPVFPSKLIELIELCMGSMASGGTTAPSTIVLGESYLSSFSANMDTNTGIFAVVEANRFKQLTHISLQLRQGNDAAIKAYLSSRLTFMSAVAGKKSHDLDGALAELEAERRQRLSINTELAELRSLRDTDVSTLRSQQLQEMSQLKMDHLSTLEVERGRYEQQLSTLRSQLETTQRDMHTAREQMEHQITELSLDRSELDFRVKELIRQLDGVQADRIRLGDDSAAAVAVRRELEDEKNGLGKDLARAEARLEALTQQLKDREETMSKTVALHRAGEEAREALEEKLHLFADNLSLTQEKLQASGGEIDKGNAIIDKLQNEGHRLKEKIKLKGEVIRKQESLVNDLRNKVADLERDLSCKKESTHSLQLETESLQRQLKDAHDRLAESNKVITSNQEVIAYLNEEINKWQIGLRGVSSSSGMGTSAGMNTDLNRTDYYATVPTPASASASASTYLGGYTGGSYAAGYSSVEVDALLGSTPSVGGSVSGMGSLAYGGAHHGPGSGIEMYPYSSSATKTRDYRDLYESTGTGTGAGAGAGAGAGTERRSKVGSVPIISPDHDHDFLGLVKKDKDHENNNNLYLKGMQNLGLGDSFGNLEDLGLDLTVAGVSAVDHYKRGERSDLTDTTRTYDVATDYLRGARERPSRTKITTGVDLESLDYYKTTGSVSGASTVGRQQMPALLATVTPPARTARPAAVKPAALARKGGSLSSTAPLSAASVQSPSHMRVLPEQYAME